MSSIPLSIRSFKCLRGNKQKEALVYLHNVIKKNSNKRHPHVFTSFELSKALNMSRQGALKILKRFSSLGFMNCLGVKKVDVDKIGAGKYAAAKNQTHFFLSEFVVVVSTVKAFFLENERFPTLLNNNTNNITRSLNNTTRNIKSLFAGMDRIPPALKTMCMESIREMDKLKITNEEKFERIKRLIKWFLSEKKSEKVEKVSEKSILFFMSEPIVEELMEELDYTERTLKDLNSQRDSWTDKQRKFWYGLKGKRVKMMNNLKELVRPFFSFETK